MFDPTFKQQPFADAIALRVGAPIGLVGPWYCVVADASCVKTSEPWTRIGHSVWFQLVLKSGEALHNLREHYF
jgi:hypothetical protein